MSFKPRPTRIYALCNTELRALWPVTTIKSPSKYSQLSVYGAFHQQGPVSPWTLPAGTHRHMM